MRYRIRNKVVFGIIVVLVLFFTLWEDDVNYSLVLRHMEHSMDTAGICGTSKPSNLIAPSPNIWQTVEEGVFYVYSAHSDPRLGNATMIRIFGIIPLDRRHGPLNNETFWCQVWQGHDLAYIQPATLYNQGHAKEKYLSGQWSCVLPVVPANLPRLTVSLVVNKSCQVPSNLLQVHHVLKRAHKKNFTVCVGGVLKHDYSNYHQLVEWFEVNRMFGMDNVMLYDYNSSHIITPYINHYKSLGMLTVIPWSLPDLGNVSNFQVIWNLGQVTAMHDCMYRNMYKSKYIMSVDLDEIIVPYGKNVNWDMMMSNAGCDDKPVAIVRNNFFGISDKWPEDEFYKNNKLVHDILRLSTLTKTKQDKYINAFPKRSKFITRSEVVDTVGIHNVKIVWGGINRNKWLCEIKLHRGRLHHYRDPRWSDIELMDNKFMHKYASEIIQRTAKVHQDVIWVNVFS